MSLNILENIDHNDIDILNSYIERRKTTILVIMFTDIIGFTKISEEMGDRYVGKILEDHNTLLTNSIEKDDRGKVIKYIGDSVMAVFSEPTRAVEVATEINKILDHYNKKHPEQMKIKVRIGLHMGQVTIDDKIQGDIFGRHVNRASRIESLADSGQIFMSLPVFDSARDFIQERVDLNWKNHGYYYLKGISKEVEIYEVYNSEAAKPKPPQKAKKKRIIPSFIFTILYIVIGVVISYGVFTYKKTETYFFDFNRQNVFIDNQKLFLDGNDQDHKRLVLNKLTKGNHVLYYDVSPSLRYYSTFTVNRGENLIEPQFTEARTPYITVDSILEDGLEVKKSLNKEITYYNSEGIKVNESIDFEVSITKSLKDNQVTYNTTWNIYSNNKLINSGAHSSKQDFTSRESYRSGWQEDESEKIYNVRYNISSRLNFYNFELQLAWY